MSNLDKQKAEARKRAMVVRKAAAQANPKAADQIIDVFQSAVAPQADSNHRYCVGGYCAIGSELNPLPLMQYLQAQGMLLALPVVVAQAEALQFRRYHPGDALVPEALGTRAPSSDKPLCLPDILLVPMLAFDHQGYRLGYGGGFYDRTLAAFQQMGHDCRLVGLAYADQQCQALPIGEFDVPLPTIITEKGIIRPVEKR